MPAPANPAGSFASKTTRQPLLWASLAYAAGAASSGYVWRPASWRFTAIAIALLAAAFWTWKRQRVAQVFVLLGIAGLAMVAAQIRAIPPMAYQFPNDSEAFVSGHVVTEGEVIPTAQGGLGQRLDVVADAVNSEAIPKGVTAGFRLSVFVPNSSTGFPQLRYGDPVRFPARLRRPREIRQQGCLESLITAARHQPRRSSWRRCGRSML